MDELISRQSVIDALEQGFKDATDGLDKFSPTCGLIEAVTGIYKCYIKQLPPIQPELQYKTNYGFMWLCPKCGLPIHSDYTKCVRCGHNREKGV